MAHLWMKQALEEAHIAQSKGEVPIGCVIVYQNTIIAASHNQTLSIQDPTAHAEIQAIRQAASYLNNHRLLETSLYITLEPCIMCYGAIIQARIPNVIFGAYDQRTGVFSQPKLSNLLSLNHHPSWEGGIMEAECAELLRSFFKTKR